MRLWYKYFVGGCSLSQVRILEVHQTYRKEELTIEIALYRNFHSPPVCFAVLLDPCLEFLMIYILFYVSCLPLFFYFHMVATIVESTREIDCNRLHA